MWLGMRNADCHVTSQFQVTLKPVAGHSSVRCFARCPTWHLHLSSQPSWATAFDNFTKIQAAAYLYHGASVMLCLCSNHVLCFPVKETTLPQSRFCEPIWNRRFGCTFTLSGSSVLHISRPIFAASFWNPGHTLMRKLSSGPVSSCNEEGREGGAAFVLREHTHVTSLTT